MRHEYTLYEAKAKLSALMRQVREGHTITITVHGTPVAELRPVEAKAVPTLADRLEEFERRGELTPAPRSVQETVSAWQALKKQVKPGALARFLEDR